MGNELDLKIFEIMEEQDILCFTGKLNILKSENKELLGTIIFINGRVGNACVGKLSPLKALMNLFISLNNNIEVDYVLEPELIALGQKKLDFPLAVLKRKATDYIQKYKESIEFKPADNLQLITKPSFILSDADTTSQEFSLLCTMSDYNLVKDIYLNNEMLDYEITNALMTLRKKEAIKVVETK